VAKLAELETSRPGTVGAKGEGVEVRTDKHGKPLVKPCRADFGSDVEFLRAAHAWKDAVTSHANRAFDEGFRAELKRLKKGKRK